jgi:hypothetical protein
LTARGPMTSKQIKAALAREALPLIAERRVSGWRWQQILDETADYLPGFTAATLRVYWARQAKGRSAAEVLAELQKEKLDVADRQRIALAARLRAVEEKLQDTQIQAYQRERLFDTTHAKDQCTIAQLRERIQDLESDLAVIDIMSLVSRR